MRIIYSDIRFMRAKRDTSLFPEVVIERLSDEGVSLVFGVRGEPDVCEDLVGDSVRLHRAFDLLRAGVIALSSAFEMIVERLELLDLLFAEPDRRDSGCVGHASRLAGDSIKREVTT